MTIRDLKILFESSLRELYPPEEVQSFFSLLCDHWLNYSRFDVSLNHSEVINPEKILKFKDAIDKLMNFEPVQYIVGQTEFYGLQLKVTKDTLIPRPETEELVAWVVKSLGTGDKVLDIGTGSGCIAIALAKNKDNIDITAMDISDKALAIASNNAELHKVKINFIEADILTLKMFPGKFNIIVSNPPYVRELEKQHMQPNVLDFEPGIALYVPNDDPLLFYKEIARFAKNHLEMDGLLFFEINEYLSDEMTGLLESMGFTEIEIHKDFRDKSRMLKCKNGERLK